MITRGSPVTGLPPPTTCVAALATGSMVSANLAMGVMRMTLAQSLESQPPRLKVMTSSAPEPYM